MAVWSFGVMGVVYLRRLSGCKADPAMSVAVFQHDKIIGMDEFITSTISQQAFNFTAFVSEDDLRISERVC